jgi:cellulose synthase operon protein C
MMRPSIARIGTVLYVVVFCATSSFAQSAPTLTQRAQQALFQQSDSVLALQLAKSALKRDRHDAEAAFIAMESAAMQSDDAETLDAALTIVAETNPEDPRAELANDRIESLAANSTTFRARLPRLRKLAIANPPLRLALVAAAADSVPELNQLASSRDAGLVTDWRIAGPFGKSPLIDFDKHYQPESDSLHADRYAHHAVEQLQFTTGRFVLPEYFSPRGIYYAASEVYITSDGMWNVFVETSGTARVYIDGNPAATRDERRPAQPQLVRTLLHLTQGKHKLLVKFTPSASPFRVALLPPTGSIRKKQNIPVLTASPESDYALASLELSRGNTVAALSYAEAAHKLHDSAAVQSLLARCWKRASEDSPEQESALSEALALDPGATQLRLELAKQRFHSDHTQEALALLKQAAASAPRSEALLRIEAQEFSRLTWRSEAETAFEALVAEHPSCDNLRLASSFYTSNERVETARRLEEKLDVCAPNSLEGARALAHRGDHLHAAQLALKVSSASPFDRSPLEFAAREFMLTSDAAAARPVALRLAELAPNSDRYQRMLQTIERGSTTLDETRSAPLALLAPYRRDGIELIRQAATKKYSGGPALWTLNDAAVVDSNGSRWLYTHRIIRLLSRDGVLNYGEVSVPRGAEILHLRTIAANGQISEPEFNQHKPTVSMPALAAGDSIEEEFLQRTPGEETRFEFGSWDAPILYSRFTLIAPPSDKPLEAPESKPAKAIDEGFVATTWEFNDLLQPIREGSLPEASQFPSVVLAGEFATIDALREHAQEQLLSASVPGARAYQLANELSTASKADTARALYRHVMRSIEDDETNGLSGQIVSAEDSLDNNEGDRAATLLALSRAAGIDTRLLLARELGAHHEASSFSNPILEFRFADGKRLLADVQNDGLPLGAVSPQLDTDHALPVIDFLSNGTELRTEEAVALAPGVPGERSTADGKLEITTDGTLHADVIIHMAPWRASQMRGVLRTVNAPDRPRFFQQLAMRLFPGATEATGEVLHENDPDEQLSIHVVCSAPSFVDLRRRSVDIDQITPALGLRSMYAKSASRTAPLLIDSVLFESSVFDVTVPDGVTFANGVDTQLKSEFGSYSTSVRQTSTRVWQMKRDFNVPLQIVAPDHYQAFSAFANRIDSIERQRLSLRINRSQIQSVHMDRP